MLQQQQVIDVSCNPRPWLYSLFLCAVSPGSEAHVDVDGFEGHVSIVDAYVHIMQRSWLE